MSSPPSIFLLILLFTALSPARAGLLGDALDPSDTPGFAERLARVRSLPETLPPADQAAILAFLADPEAPAPHGLSARETLRNELTSHLVRSAQSRDTLADTLASAALDPAHTPTWRDYTLQHLGDLLPHLDPDRRATTARLLFDSTQSPVDNHAATALLSLHRALRAPEVDPQTLADRAHALASDPTQPHGNRLNGLHVLTHLQDERALPLARTLLATRHSSLDTRHTPSLPLRLAALHTLGQLGGPGDFSLAETHFNNPHPPIRRAAHAAAARLTPSNDPHGD